MSQIKMLFAIVFAALVTGCASLPAQFASPDTEGRLYTVGEGDILKAQKPEPRTIGLRETGDAPNFYEIVDFKEQPYQDDNTIPDSHLIGVRAEDPESGGEIVVPIQYIDKLRGSKAIFYVEHSISGLKSPLKLLDIEVNGLDGLSAPNMLWHFTPQGKPVNPIFIIQTNSDPMRSIEDFHDGNLIEDHIQKRWEHHFYDFYHGEKFEKAMAEHKDLRKKRMKEHQKNLEKAQRQMNRRETLYKRALSATKSVGEQVCSTDRWVGNVEQIASDRIKVSIIGKASLPADWLIAEYNYNLNFDIDTDQEGKLRWFDSNEIGKCTFDITR